MTLKLFKSGGVFSILLVQNFNQLNQTVDITVFTQCQPISEETIHKSATFYYIQTNPLF